MASQWQCMGSHAVTSARVINNMAAEAALGEPTAAVEPARAKPNVTGMSRLPERGVLWIDAVGGYLLCFNDAVMIGQSIPGTSMDIPILGDLSRHQATIYRSGEGYVLEPYGRCAIEGKPCAGPSELHDGDEIRLGERVELRFRRPHPLSTTARLDMISRHRMQPSVDGILLMGSSCLLGPDPRMHVVCRHWQYEVNLSRAADGSFRYRTVHRVEIDGRPAAAAGRLAWNERLSGDDFALTVEPLE